MCDGHNMFLSRREDKTKQVRRAFSEGSVHHRPRCDDITSTYNSRPTHQFYRVCLEIRSFVNMCRTTFGMSLWVLR